VAAEQVGAVADGGPPDDATRRSLERARFELVPMRGVDGQLEHLPPGAVVTVTASPTRGLDATVELVTEVVARGHRAVPHLSARLVRSEAHLDRLLDRLHELALREVFVIAGDTPSPAGPFEGAADLLEAIAARGRPFEHVGISGYPETHAFLTDRVVVDAMQRKLPHATYIVSQICYDPVVVRGWLSTLRARGVVLPVYVGLPGVIDRAKLLRVSLRVGLGDSVRFLRKQSDVATHVLTGYTPDELVWGLADLLHDPHAGVAGWHLFTFNEVERTERWRQELLAGKGGPQT
jgi:methylenetetrahydrofolate reductase (NADPH)